MALCIDLPNWLEMYSVRSMWAQKVECDIEKGQSDTDSESESTSENSEVPEDDIRSPCKDKEGARGPPVTDDNTNVR